LALKQANLASVAPGCRCVQLADLGAAPARVAHFFLASGHPALAIPYVLPAVETAGALGAYRDALELVDAVRDHAHGDELGHLLARRGDLLMALADPESVNAYRDALPVTSGTENRLVRARLARAACFVGDFESARRVLEGLEPAGDAAAPRRLRRAGDDPSHHFDLLGLQGLIAHQRGEWFEWFRREVRQEVRRSSGKPGLATALFDAHLCVAEYLLYGPVPYTEVIARYREPARSCRPGRRPARDRLRHVIDRGSGSPDGRHRAGRA